MLLLEGKAMKIVSFAAFASVSLLALAVLSSHAADSSLTLSDSMKDVIAPKTQIVWDVGNKAMNDKGEPDASMLTDDDWKKIIEAGDDVSARLKTLAGVDRLKVAQPGVKIQSEGNPGAWGAADVQKAIDADPKGFKVQAMKLAAAIDATVAAAKARNAQSLQDNSNQIDGICEDCHKQYWYPNLK
jgi:cytochrome c556